MSTPQPGPRPAPRGITDRLGPLAARVERPLIALCVLAGAIVRFTPSTPLWLDEALTVNIAASPLGDIADLLRHDGHPPLYYWLLHGWIELFGTGAVAVRALSGIFGLGAIAMVALVGRRLGGPRLGRLAAAVLAVMPFGIRYSSEARMYELVTLFVLVGWWLVDRALFDDDRPPTGRVDRVTLVALGLLSGALLLTNYWAMFFLATVGLGLLLVTWTGRRRGDAAFARAGLQVIVAIALGGVLFLPWLSTFRYQAAHTGTPWAPASRPTRVVSESLIDWAGGIDPEPILLLALCAGLLTIGLFGTISAGRLTLGPVPSPARRRLVWTIGVTFVIGAAASMVSKAAYAGRYSSVVFPFWVLLIAAGLALLTMPAVRVGVLLVLVVLAGATVALHLKRDRSQAGEVAAVINAHASAGDLVMVCPDQLGPALARLVHVDGVRVVRYPDFGDPRFVDWVDYGERLDTVSVPDVAARIDAEAGANRVWFVWSGTYRVVGPQCDEMSSRLAALRPGTLQVEADTVAFFEAASLLELGGR